MSQVRVKSGREFYLQEISSRDHTWPADEPEDRGGTDVGPTPYEMLLGALGACTTITVQMYARRKGWDLKGITVDLEHRRIHAADCADCQSKEGFISRIDTRVSFQGELSQEQKERLFEIAGRCPVKKTLEGEVVIRSELS